MIPEGLRETCVKESYCCRSAHTDLGTANRYLRKWRATLTNTDGSGCHTAGLSGAPLHSPHAMRPFGVQSTCFRACL